MNEKGKNGVPFLFGVNFEMTEGFFIENPMGQHEILFNLKGVGNSLANVELKKQFTFLPYPLRIEQYESKYKIVLDNLKKGNSFLTNLTVKTPLEMDLSLSDIFHSSLAPYKLLLPNRFVCFSPERFVKILGKIISTNPMKGTIDAHIPNATEQILNDCKETAEHNTIVDLLRNDLSMVANHVTVNRFRYIDHIKTNNKDILQVSSEITGELNDKYVDCMGDTIFRMLPAGSICGAPKQATISVIKEAEQEQRNYYAGVFGYYDGRELDTAVMIRFIEQSDNQFYFRSGGGITAYSDCEKEYDEVLNKIYLPIG